MKKQTNGGTGVVRTTSIAFAIALFGLAFWVGTRYGASRIDKETINEQAQALQSIEQPLVVYSCDSGKSVWARYFPEGVSLALSDGRRIELSHATSGSGSRYALPDDSIVFWAKGRGAALTEDGEATYEGCEEQGI